MIVERRDKVYLGHTDASGVIYFGAPAQWLMHSAADLLVGLGLVLPREDGFSTPARALSIEYLRPMVAHDEFVQRTYIASVGHSSFAIQHEFWVEDEIRMRATMTHVCLSLITREKLPVPEEIRAAVVRTPDSGREQTWRAQLTAAGISVHHEDLRMLRLTERTVGPLRDALARFDLAAVEPERVLDYASAPAE